MEQHYRVVLEVPEGEVSVTEALARPGRLDRQRLLGALLTHALDDHDRLLAATLSLLFPGLRIPAVRAGRRFGSPMARCVGSSRGSRLMCDVSEIVWRALLDESERSGESLSTVVDRALGAAFDLDRHSLFQVSTSNALVQGVFRGAVTVGDRNEAATSAWELSKASTGSW